MNSVNAISIYIVDDKLIKMKKQLENLNQTNEKTNVTRESYLSTLTLFQDIHIEKKLSQPPFVKVHGQRKTH